MVNNLGKDWLMGVSHSVGPILFFVQKELREQPHICNCKDTKFFVEIQLFRVKNALYSQLSTFPLSKGWVLGLVLGLLLGGVLGLVFVFCIPFTQRHFRKIGVGLSKNCTSTPLKGDEDGAEDRRTGSSKFTNWQLHNHKVPLYVSKYRTYFPKYMT